MSEVAAARAVGAPPTVISARPYGLWRGWLLGRFAGDSWPGQLAWDTLALMSFQVPLYAAVLWAGGAEGARILRGSCAAASVAVTMLVAGRPYGLWLGWVRAGFGLPSGGVRPMSLPE